MDFNKVFSRLNSKERAVAYFLAIDNANSGGLYDHTFLKKFKLLQREYDEAIKKIGQLGILRSRGWFKTSYVLIGNARINVIKYMFENDYRLYQSFLDIFVANNNATNTLAALRYAFYGEGANFNGKIDHATTSAVLSYAEEPWISRILTHMTAEDVMWYIDNTFYNYSITGELLSRDTISRLCSSVKLSPSQTEFIEGLKKLYLYMAYGDYDITEVPLTRDPWTIVTAAIHDVLEGNYEQAIIKYSAAFKILNRQSLMKNVFVDIFPQYFLVLAYMHVDNSTSTTKLATFINKKDVSDFISLAPSKYLARTYLNGNKVPQDNSLRPMMTANFGNYEAGNVRFMGHLFDRYFEIDSDKAPISVPKYAIMRHELSDYIDLSEEEREQLRLIYGEKPALTSIVRKRNWELLIDEVVKAAKLGSDIVMPTLDNLPDSRVVYVRNRFGEFEPKLQTRMKNGGWSKPKILAKGKFYNHQHDFMDDTDRIIAKIMAPSQFSAVTHDKAEDFLPYLVGSDRVYGEDNLDYISIIVENEKPFISIEKAPNRMGYMVSSNVALQSLQKMANGCVTQEDGKNKYKVIALSESQRKVIEKLLSAPYFPKEAKTALQKFLTRLDDLLEVRSSLLDASAAENVEGSATIAIKVEPNAGLQYTLGLYAKPLASSSTYCIPGSGKAVMYITDGAANFRVKRNLKEESVNYKEIVDILDTQEHPMGDDEIVTTVEAEQLLEILEFARQNPDKAIVEWPEGKGIIVRQPLSQGSWSVGIKQTNGWFDLEGEVKIDDGTVVKMSKLLDIIASEKGRFVRLGENDFVEIDKKLRRQLERIEALAVRNRNKVQISTFNAGLLDDSVLDSTIKIEVDDSLTQLRQRIKDSADETPSVPKALNAILRPYQVEGFQWMMRLASWGAGACLADDMGLGKTVQTIAFLLAKAQEGPALIVAPASVVPNWRNELQRFAPTLNVEILNRADDRKATIKKAKKRDVLITTYGLLNTEVAELSKKKWTTICLDEAHTIKNRDTKMSKVAMILRTTYRIALTGTPIQNHLGELWNLFNFINPGLLGQFESFRNKYAVPIMSNNDKDRRRALQRIIQPFMLRRTKSEVIDDLPEKTDIVLPIELSDAEMAMYEAMRKRAVEALESATTLDVNTLAELTKLRRAACSVSLIDKDWIGKSAKVQAFLELVRSFKGENNRMLVFSQFTSFLDIVRKALDEAEESYLYLDGSTTMKQREKLVEEFQQGDCPLFLISLKAGGLGLNLTGANYVVHLDPWWNPAIEQQATDRSYRIGQQRNVTVYHLLAKNTIEEKIRRLHQTKRDLADSLLEGTDMAGKLTIADVLKLVAD